MEFVLRTILEYAGKSLTGAEARLIEDKAIVRYRWIMARFNQLCDDVAAIRKALEAKD
jgi:hypothetical protein